MNVERGKIESGKTPDSKAALDAQLDAILENAMDDPAYAAIFADPEASLARGMADVAAGRVHSHEIVSEWLKTWGDANYKPFHEWLNARG